MIYRRAALALVAGLPGIAFRPALAEGKIKGSLDGWGPFKFGMTVDAAKGIAPADLIPGNVVNGTYTWWFRAEIEEISTKVTLYFTPLEGALRLGKVLLQPDDLIGHGAPEKYQLLVDKVGRKYGLPDEEVKTERSFGTGRTRIYKFDDGRQVYFHASEKEKDGKVTEVSFIAVEYGPTPSPPSQLPKAPLDEAGGSPRHPAAPRPPSLRRS